MIRGIVTRRYVSLAHRVLCAVGCQNRSPPIMKPRLPYKCDNAKAHHAGTYPGSRVDGSNRFPNIWRCQVAAWQCRDLTLLCVLECPSCEHRLAIDSPVPELALVNTTRFPVLKTEAGHTLPSYNAYRFKKCDLKTNDRLNERSLSRWSVTDCVMVTLILHPHT